MSWNELDPNLRSHIETVCTPKELEALKLRIAGYGRRRIAVALNISESSVRTRLENAQRKTAIYYQEQK